MIGVELMTLGVDLESILLDSNNKHVFKQSSCVDYHWCRIDNTLVPIWNLYY